MLPHWWETNLAKKSNFLTVDQKAMLKKQDKRKSAPRSISKKVSLYYFDFIFPNHPKFMLNFFKIFSRTRT
jgi:hypothetical protein